MAHCESTDIYNTEAARAWVRTEGHRGVVRATLHEGQKQNGMIMLNMFGGGFRTMHAETRRATEKAIREVHKIGVEKARAIMEAREAKAKAFNAAAEAEAEPIIAMG